MTSVILSQDLICEILRRLSVNDLLRFRCVSKSWCSLIDSSDFIKLHLSHSVETSTNLSLFLNRRGGDNISSVNIDSLKTAQRLEFPGDESDKGKGFVVLGSCNGLLALLKCPNVPWPLFKMWIFKRNDELYLWNPSTRKSQMLQANEIGFTPQVFSPPHVWYGFGYDPISDDYKLVRIVQSFCLTVDFFESEVMVYSLKTNYWRRRRKDFPFLVKDARLYSAVLVNNALHWEVSTNLVKNYENFDSDFDVIAAFHLGTEEYYAIEYPDCLGERPTTITNVMGGCLCLIATYREVGVDYVVDIWIMKEYGMKESWTKIISVKTFECFQAAPCVLPLVFSKNGDKVLLHFGGMLFFYDLRSKKADKVNIEDVPFLHHDVEMMVKSLVPLNGNGAMFNNKNQHGGKTKRKNTERDDILSKRIHQL